MPLPPPVTTATLPSSRPAMADGSGGRRRPCQWSAARLQPAHERHLRSPDCRALRARRHALARQPHATQRPGPRLLERAAGGIGELERDDRGARRGARGTRARLHRRPRLEGHGGHAVRRDRSRRAPLRSLDEKPPAGLDHGGGQLHRSR